MEEPKVPLGGSDLEPAAILRHQVADSEPASVYAQKKTMASAGQMICILTGPP